VYQKKLARLHAWQTILIAATADAIMVSSDSSSDG
jgi:hypothetical protein